MFRITILCRLAVQLGFLSIEATEQLITAYRAAIAADASVPFMKWTIEQGYLTRPQAQQIKQAYAGVSLECLNCGHRFPAGESDIRKPLVCTKCASADLAMRDTHSESVVGATLLEVATQGQPTDVLRTFDQTAVQPQAVARPTTPIDETSSPPSEAFEDLSSRLPYLDSLSEDGGSSSGSASAGTGRGPGATADNADASDSGGDTSLFEPPRDTRFSAAKPAGDAAPPPPPKPATQEVRNALPGTYSGGAGDGAGTSAGIPTYADYDELEETTLGPATSAAHGSGSGSGASAARENATPMARRAATAAAGKRAAGTSRASRRKRAVGAGNGANKAAAARARASAPGSEAVVPPGTVIAGCRILKKVGQGGMGAVYKAHHLRLDKPVAVKILAPHLVENQIQVKRFIREGRSAARLEHANIVTVHDVGQENRRFYLIMQWVDGQSLQEVLDREGVLPADKAVDYILQAARGLHAGHVQNIIHRDVKPDNLMLTQDGRIKVTDFGLAKGTKEDLNVSQTGVILGTPYYMSPEQGQNDRVDHRTDIYSLGITLYQLLTGKVPFTGTSAVQIIVKHIKEKMTPPRMLVPSLPEALEAVVLRMTEKERSARYQGLDEVIADLERLLPSLSGEAPDPQAVPSPELFISTPAEVSEEERTKVLRNLIAARENLDGERAEHKSEQGVAPEAGRARYGGAVAVLVAVVLLLAAGAAAYYYMTVLLPQQQAVAGDSNDPRPVAISGGTGTDQPSGEGQPTDGNNPNTTNPPPDDSETNPGQPDEPVTWPLPDPTMPDAERAEQERLVLERFHALVTAFEQEIANFAVYDDYQRRFRDLLTEYGYLAAVRDVISGQLNEMRELRNNAASRWLRQHLPEYTDWCNQLQFVQALAVLDGFAPYFHSTETAARVRALRDEISAKARLERDAQQLYDRLDATLNRTPSEGALREASELLDQLDVPAYRGTRFGIEIAGLRARFRQMRLALDSTLDTTRQARLERQLNAIRLEIANDRRQRAWRVAMLRIVDAKPDFEGSDLLRQLDALEKEVRLEATAAWETARERVQREIDAGNYAEVFRRLDAASDGALHEHAEEAERMRVAFIETYVPQQLQALEDARNGEAGARLAAEFLGVGEFQRVRDLIERYQARFALLNEGMVPVRLPDGASEVAAPDGSGTWRVGEFWIARHEVTREQYRAFIDAGGYEQEALWSETGWQMVQAGEFRRLGVNQPAIGWRHGRPEPGTEQWPVTSIGFYEAQAYARWAKKSLPSAIEWAVAAGYDPALADGEGGFRRYPWGDSFLTVTRSVPARLTTSPTLLAEPSPVGRHPQDVSPWGVFDMGGNVAEWTRDAADGPNRQWVVGGWFNAFPEQAEEIAQSTYRQGLDRRDRSPWVGLRLVTRLD